LRLERSLDVQNLPDKYLHHVTEIAQEKMLSIPTYLAKQEEMEFMALLSMGLTSSGTDCQKLTNLNLWDLKCIAVGSSYQLITR
jgi:hypothetical protein